MKQRVWVRTGDKQTRGRIVATADTPRSYIVSTSGGIVRRNRQHLITVPGTQQDGHSEDKSNETLLTEEENSMNDDVNPSNEENEESEMWMMKRTINGISNLRDQAQSPCARDLEQALP
eukprot:Em0013g399a